MIDFQNTKPNEDVKNLLNFAGGIISARDRVHLQMSEHRMGVFRQEFIDGLVVSVSTSNGFRKECFNSLSRMIPFANSIISYLSV